MRSNILGLIMLAAGAMASPAASQTLYALSSQSSFSELLTYDLTQDPFSGTPGYKYDSIAPLNTSILPPSSMASTAIWGNTLYVLSRQSSFDELLTYDLTQDPFSGVIGYQYGSIAPMNTSILPPGSIADIAISGNTLYALSRQSSFDELLTYDLTQDPFSGVIGYQYDSIAPMNTSILPAGSISSIAISGTTLYALSVQSSFDELLTYDLTQDPFSGIIGYQYDSIAPMNTSILPPGSVADIAISGTTLYALSRQSSFDELLTYDLTQDPFSGVIGYQYDSIAPMDTSILPPASIASLSIWDPAATTPPGSDVPEPASWLLMLAGFGVIGCAMRRRPLVRATAG